MDVRSFREIIGQKDITQNLRNAIKADKVSHAYLFTGEKGRGKKLVASVFAAALQCENGGDTGEPCQMCRACKKSFNNSHPDIIYVTHEKASVITVDEIREQVVDTSVIKPYEGKYKVYIIEDADKMNPQAQNAILKTIEEPPEYVVIILLSANQDAMLQTILSRCITLSFHELQDEDIKDYLVRTLHVNADDAGVITAFSQGNIGKAKSVALSEDFKEKVQSTVDFISKIKSLSLEDCVAEAAKLAKDKANISEQLDVYELWFRDILVYKATQDIDEIIFKEKRSEVSYLANSCNYEDLSNVFDAVEMAKTRLKANVSTELVLQLLFMTIKES